MTCTTDYQHHSQLELRQRSTLRILSVPNVAHARRPTPRRFCAPADERCVTERMPSAQCGMRSRGGKVINMLIDGRSFQSKRHTPPTLAVFHCRIGCVRKLLLALCLQLIDTFGPFGCCHRTFIASPHHHSFPDPTVAIPHTTTKLNSAGTTGECH